MYLTPFFKCMPEHSGAQIPHAELNKDHSLMLNAKVVIKPLFIVNWSFLSFFFFFES